METPGKGENDDEPAVEMSADDLLQVGIRYHQMGYFPSAGQAYVKILEAIPGHPGALNFLGVLKHQIGQSEEGINLIRSAVESAPDYADAWNNLGNVLWTLGRREEAADAYRRVIDLAPGHAGALNNLGLVHKDREELSIAEGLYRRAIEADPDHMESHRNLGNLLLAVEREADGLALLQRALELNPRSALVYDSLGRAYRKVDNLPAAVGVYREWLSFDPDSETAKHHLAALTGENVPDRASVGYVAEQFDQFADSFDDVLTRLEYCGPALCFEALGRAVPDADGTLEVLDAGCGTGLCGEGLRPFARRLTGVDLSTKMLEKARATGHYDALEKVDLTEYLRSTKAIDAIVAADTLIYFGRLEPLLEAAAGAMSAGGFLVFTVEKGEDPGPRFELGPNGRYRHRESYLTESLAGAGFELRDLRSAVIRREREDDVPGYVVTARLPG